MKYWGRNSNCCIVQPGQCVLPAVSSLSGNYPSLSLSLPPSAKHNLYPDRDDCFRDQHFPNRDAGKRYCAIATLGCWVRAGSRTRAAEMILAGGQSRDNDPSCSASSLHHCSPFKVRMLPTPFKAQHFHLTSGHLSNSTSTSFPLEPSYSSQKSCTSHKYSSRAQNL